MRFVFVFWLLSGTILGQNRETFDIATFISPVGWQRESNENTVSYVATNHTTGAWCRFMVYKSMISTGSPQNDFEAEWTQLVTPYYQTSNPSKPELSEKDG